MPLPSTPQPVAPAAAPQAEVHAYQQVGGLQAEHLLLGTPHQFAHLYEKIEDLLKFAQDRITRDGKSDMAAAAPYEPEIKTALHSYLDRLLMQFLAKESFARTEDRHILVSTVINHIAGLGVIEPLWMDPRITEVMVNGPDDVYVEIEGRVRPVPGCQFRSQGDLEALCQRILAPLNRRVDPASPMADGRLPDGSRVNIVHHAIAPGGPLLTIRRFPETKWTLAALVDNGSVSDDMACELAYLVYHRASILVVGGTGSGKALDVDTPIPTPSGFTRMGDLDVGHVVLDEHGQPCNVTAVFDQPPGRDCFEVEFSDGSTIVADADHNWWTETRSARRASSRATHGVRQRWTRWSDGDVADASRIVSALPEAVSIREFCEAFGWYENASYEQVVRRAAAAAGRSGATMIEFPSRRGGKSYTGRKSVPTYPTRDLLANVTVTLTKPWHDQRHLSATAGVATTREIADTLKDGPHSNHSVRVMDGVAAFPEQHLPVDPYLLGVWLGDGSSTKAEIATEDQQIVEAFEAHGYKVTRYSANRCNHGIAGGFKASLRAIGVLGNKHIPDLYLFSSEAQRRALLAGLLDSDGTPGHKSQVIFYNTNQTLAEQVRTLAASLGYQCRIGKRPARLNGIDHGVCYVVTFSAYDDVFGLDRKNSVHRTSRAHTRPGRDERRYITAVRPVPERPVRCITVDSPSHLFLCGDQYIPTHNTSLLNALSSCIPRGERVVTVEDSLELQFHHGAHVAAMEGRPAGTSGTGEIRIRDLVKNALRMRPDRIVVGEVRDSAALDMLQAMNTGHEGSMTTVHANGPSEAMTRMSVLVAQGGEIPEDKVQWLIGDAVDVLVMQTRYEDGSRRVSGIYEVPTMRANSGEVLEPIPLWEWEQTGTTEDGKYEGHYVRRNEISEHLRRMRRLDQFERFTIADIRRFALEGA